MTTILHERSAHIDAPVEKVFEYMADPQHLVGAFPEKDRAHMAIMDIERDADGVVTSYRMMGRMFLLFHMEWTLKREEYVPNERIVDHANTGGVWKLGVAPGDPSGTELTIAFGWSSKVPFVGQALDRVTWDGDSDLDAMLAEIKKAIEG